MIPKNNVELRKIIKEEISIKGPLCDLNHIDVSNVTDFSNLFEFSDFNGDISQWNTSHVTNMTGLFSQSKFNGDISNWDTSNVTKMLILFCNSKFNGDISNWNTSKVTNVYGIFNNAEFKGDISKWCVTSFEKMAPSRKTKDYPLNFEWSPFMAAAYLDGIADPPKFLKTEQINFLKSLLPDTNLGNRAHLFYDGSITLQKNSQIDLLKFDFNLSC